MVTHVVMWTVKDSDGESRETLAQSIKKKIETMHGKVTHFESLEVGLNRNESSASCDVVLISRHRDWEQFASYRDDPFHKEVAAFVTERTASRAVVDYES